LLFIKKRAKFLEIPDPRVANKRKNVAIITNDLWAILKEGSRFWGQTTRHRGVPFPYSQSIVIISYQDSTLCQKFSRKYYFYGSSLRFLQI